MRTPALMLSLLLGSCIPSHLQDGVRDRDGDGFDATAFCDGTYEWGGADPDSSACSGGGDCDDYDQAVHPGADEVCGDRADNDCDGNIDDDGLGARGWFADTDGDNFGDAQATLTACNQPEGYVDNAADCDDRSDTTHPGAVEVCDDLDNDCDTDVDESAVDAPTWYFDDDGDGYGVDSPTQTGCDQPAGYAAVPGDCDDTLAAVNPGAQEVCSGRDDDCDTLVDQDDPSMSGLATWYLDSDGDEYGISGETVQSCEAPNGYAAQPGDCDDGNAAVNPGADEVCDGDDDDYGLTGTLQLACAPPSAAYVASPGDCLDTDAEVYPGAPELCDGILDDCDASVLPADEVDNDGDGYVECDVTVWKGPGTVAGLDCDDTTIGQFGVPGSAINPGEPEVCRDRVDNDCDGDWEECRLSGNISLGAADAIFYGDEPGQRVGQLVTIGNVRGGSTPEVLILYGDGSYDGGVYVLQGPTFGASMDPSDAVAEVSSSLLADYQFRGLTVCDMDDDGTGDLFVSVSGTTGDSIRGFGGSLSGFLNYSTQSDWAFQPSAEPYFDLACADVDGDGDDDLVAQSGGPYLAEQLVRVFRGPRTQGTHSANSAELVISVGDLHLEGVGDLDGDDAAEILVADTYNGVLYLFAGNRTGNLSGAIADMSIQTANQDLDWTPIGILDFDGNGTQDLLVGESPWQGQQIWASLFHGPLEMEAQTLATSAADVTVEPEAGYGTVAAVGDLDGDGRDDLVIANRGDDTIGSDAGAVHVVYGRPDLVGAHSLTSITNASLLGEGVNDQAAMPSLAVGDVNADEFEDLVLGVPEADGASGGVYLFLGSGL